MSTLTALNCPSCGAPLPDISARRVQHVVCEYCDEMLDVHDAFKSLGKMPHIKSSGVVLALGDRGTLRGVEHTVIAVMRYSCDGESWHEYSLFSPTHGYAFLCQDEALHWTLSRRSRQVYRNGVIAYHDDEAYLCAEKYRAQLDYVVGQLTWRAEVGEITKCREYLRSGKACKLVEEQGGNEVEFFVEEYLPVEDVRAGFGVELEAPRGRVELNQYQASGLLDTLATWGLRFFVICTTLTLLIDFITLNPQQAYAGKAVFSKQVLTFTPARMTQLQFTQDVDELVRACQLNLYQGETHIEDLGAALRQGSWDSDSSVRHVVKITRRFAAAGQPHALHITRCSNADRSANFNLEFFDRAWPTRYIFYLGLVFLAFRIWLGIRRALHEAGV